MAELDRLIAEAEAWRVLHHNAGRKIEACAAAIRLRALKDAKAAILRDG